MILKNTKKKFREGLFGQGFLWPIQVLPHFYEKNIDPKDLKWELHTESYGNLFPNFLEDYHTNETDRTVVDFHQYRKQHCYVLGDDYKKISMLFHKYFKIPEKFEHYAYEQQLDGYLGIHIRGTDKTSDTTMNTPMSCENQIKVITEFIRINNITKVFLCTDEPSIIPSIQKRVGDIKLKHNSKSTKNIFWRDNAEPFLNGYDAMLDMMCLSKCKTILKTSSALSSIPKILNPNINILRLNASRLFINTPYWPDGFLPLIDINENYSDEVKFILKQSRCNEWSDDPQRVKDMCGYNLDKFQNFDYFPRIL